MVKQRATIDDVARAAGVSKSLVSFALNGKPGVAPQSRDRILRAAGELGWVPSVRARSLTTARAYALGLVIARDPAVISEDSFFPAFIAGIEAALAPVGQALVLSMVPDERAEHETYRQLVAHDRVDGVILTDLRESDSRVPLLRELGLLAVTLGHPQQHSEFPAVSVDDAPGIRAAVDHLVDLGHRRIAHVAGSSGMLHAARRSMAFSEALTLHGLRPDLVVEADFTAQGGAKATRDLLALEHPPTAIVYANDPMALAGMGVAQRLGLRVPEDLSVTGFDGGEAGRHNFPALTTVVTSVQEWGGASARALLSLIAGLDVADSELDPARLVVRESTASPVQHRASRALSAEKSIA
ncbi:LacI family transcriptional regulator [Salinibacterium hongtaonis]|uniref:LacI family transcriptional regulator n=2 Tax=Homoserinimonas hongtaonis TaxID=2079791 RepID=A0A2U1T1E0_9MICO|nr:LacI family transcriptional regulator [Salinibacterium hongtaonis]